MTERQNIEDKIELVEFFGLGKIKSDLKRIKDNFDKKKKEDLEAGYDKNCHDAREVELIKVIALVAIADNLDNVREELIFSRENIFRTGEKIEKILDEISTAIVTSSPS